MSLFKVNKSDLLSYFCTLIQSHEIIDTPQLAGLSTD
jgi:hypothetical protein